MHVLCMNAGVQVFRHADVAGVQECWWTGVQLCEAVLVE